MNDEKKTKLVEDDTTIYEVDLECVNCQNTASPPKKSESGTLLWEFPAPTYLNDKT